MCMCCGVVETAVAAAGVAVIAIIKKSKSKKGSCDKKD